MFDFQRFVRLRAAEGERGKPFLGDIVGVCDIIMEKDVTMFTTHMVLVEHMVEHMDKNYGGVLDT